MKVFVKDKTQHTVYDSLSEFFTHTDIDNPPSTMYSGNKDGYSDVKNRSDKSWRYGDERDHETYIEKRFDAEKGKKLCEQVVKSTTTSKEYRELVKLAMTYRKRVHFEDHGCRLNVPKAISGEDRYFTTFKNARKPIVKIAINICGSACVEQDQFRKIAQTAIPTIYALEAAGIATEVWFTAFSDGTYHSSEFNSDGVHIPLKSAQQRFNWTTFAPVFTLASFRESIFLTYYYSQYKATSGLGCPMKDDKLRSKENYGYTCVIGLNAPGPVDTIKELFSNFHKSST